MRSPRRPQPASNWMQGYGAPPTLEATCQALEARLREGRPAPFADAERLPFTEQDWWSL